MTLTQIYQLADDCDVKVLTVDLLGDKSATIECKNKYGIGIDDKEVLNEADEKICLAHELGHIETGSFYNINNVLDVYSKHERRADKWAIQKLVTADELYQAVSAGNYEIWQLAEYFDIPEDYMKKIVCYYEGWDW